MAFLFQVDWGSLKRNEFKKSKGLNSTKEKKGLHFNCRIFLSCHDATAWDKSLRPPLEKGTF